MNYPRVFMIFYPKIIENLDNRKSLKLLETIIEKVVSNLFNKSTKIL